MMRFARTLLAALLACSACTMLAPPAPAHASPSLLSFIMDDDLLLYGTYSDRAFAMNYMKRAGADGVRVTVSWKFVSGQSNGRPVKQPARFKGKRAENPRSYRSDIWDRFDDIVRLAKANDMVVLFNVTGPGPVWAQGKAPHSRRFDQPAWKPRAPEFKHFVAAVAKRYAGNWLDENQDRSLLPRVNVWSIYNEVNQPASLSPQMEYNRQVRHQIPVAPILYRNLYYAATDALRQTGHTNDLIMMGETAPLGGVSNTPRVHLWPKQFIREMFCLKPNLQPYRGLEAKVRQCSTLRRRGPFLVKAYAHHPYTQKNPPTRRDRYRDSINMANIAELPAYLDRIADKTKLIPKGLPVALTEIGWETRPPDPTRGVTIRHQADWLNQADHMAFDQPRVFMNTQFVLRDVKPRAKYRGKRRFLSQYWATWQSGLLFANGKPKPAFTAYLMPFDAKRRAGMVDIWGQLRFFPNGVGADMYLQFRPAGSKSWVFAGGPYPTDPALGYWSTQIKPPGPGVWRAALPYGNAYVYSREVSVPF